MKLTGDQFRTIIHLASIAETSSATIAAYEYLVDGKSYETTQKKYGVPESQFDTALSKLRDAQFQIHLFNKYKKLNDTISEEQFNALATLIRVSKTSTARKVAKLVLVDGKTMVEAAKEAKTTRQKVFDAVKRFRDAYKLAVTATA